MNIDYNTLNSISESLIRDFNEYFYRDNSEMPFIPRELDLYYKLYYKLYGKIQMCFKLVEIIRMKEYSQDVIKLYLTSGKAVSITHFDEYIKGKE